jgi:tetratricopeptide (TPR) repeat protein
MCRSPSRSFPAHSRSRDLALGVLVALSVGFAGCKSPKKSPPTAAPTADLAAELAAARTDAAKMKLEQQRPDEALALLVSALNANPASEEIYTRVEELLQQTVWNLPAVTLNHHQPIEHIAMVEPSTLWVSLGGETNTTVRWNFQTLRIESVLFPTPGSKTRSLVIDPSHRWAVIERGPVTLLCHAQSLKPVCDLGKLPPDLIPAAVVVFSADGLLLAHPSHVSAEDHSIIWQLRDAASGEIIRTSAPVPADAPQPLAATLDHDKLKVLHADGSLLEIPISPVEEGVRTPLQGSGKLRQAVFSADGKSALTLQTEGAHQPLEQAVISYSDQDDGTLEDSALLRRMPWSLEPNIWSSVISDSRRGPFWIDENTVKILTSPHAPVSASSPPTAIAFATHAVFTGEQSGVLTLHRLLPLPVKISAPPPRRPLDSASLSAIGNWSDSLTGVRYDEKTRTFLALSLDDRRKASAACDFTLIRKSIPTLDFTALVKIIHASEHRAAPPLGFLPLWNRLVNADVSRESWPALLERAKGLVDTTWHRGLVAAMGQQDLNRPATPSEMSWSTAANLPEVFRVGDSEAVLAAIQSTAGKGPAAATALALALKSERHEWIDACLATAQNLPVMLREIARSRSAWLQGDRARALAPWPEVMPELSSVRQREDWEGWEQADFQPALDELRRCMSNMLATITIPVDSTPEQRAVIAACLLDPTTVRSVGPRRFGMACLAAAQACSPHKEEAAATLQLARLARDMGAQVEPSLRAEAVALTALGDYQQAHPCWIKLITEYPVERTLPLDYAEAAYTAFENADPQQAMEILTTGMHRFPQDGNFALRAGWVSLLTNNPQRAYQFLQNGKRIGFPPEKLENATALLAISASQTGAEEDAQFYFQELLRIDPAWADPTTLDTLDWPLELKAVLGQFLN